MIELWKPTPLCSGTYVAGEELRVVPYQRLTQATRWSADAKRYYASRDRLLLGAKASIAKLDTTWQTCPSCRGRRVKQGKRCKACEAVGQVAYRYTGAWRLGCVYYVPRTAEGHLTSRAGDFDNIAKAVADALVYHRVLRGDAPRYFRGPAPVGEIPSGIYANPERRYHLEWALYEALDLNAGPASNAEQLGLGV